MSILGSAELASTPLAKLYRFSGALMIVLALATSAAGIGGSISLLTTLIAAIAAGAIGMGAIGQASRLEARAREQRSQRLKQRVLELAKTHRGDLTAMATAQALRLDLHEADALLTSMADGNHVHVEVDSDGIVHYVFRELAIGAPLKVRVDPRVLEDADSTETEAEARVERALRKRDRI